MMKLSMYVYWRAYLNFGHVETKTENIYILIIKNAFRLRKAKRKTKVKNKKIKYLWKRVGNNANN